MNMTHSNRPCAVLTIKTGNKTARGRRVGRVTPYMPLPRVLACVRTCGGKGKIGKPFHPLAVLRFFTPINRRVVYGE